VETFRVLEHTADVGFEAFGWSLDEVYANAARALFYLIVELDQVGPAERISVTVQGTDREALLVNWLSELLFLHDSEGWLFREFKILRIEDTSLNAVAIGERFHASRHHLKMLVKAITYHQLALGKTSEGWRAQVYVDI